MCGCIRGRKKKGATDVIIFLLKYKINNINKKDISSENFINALRFLRNAVLATSSF